LLGALRNSAGVSPFPLTHCRFQEAEDIDAEIP
jgi:hypothetical protein